MTPRPTRRRAATFALRLEPLEDRRVPATLTVDTADDGSDPSVLTLREAIEVVNGTLTLASLSAAQQAQVTGTLGSGDAIDFNIPGAGVHTISPLSALPFVTRTVTINGYSQPGASPNTLATGDNAVILIQIDGANTPAGNSGLVFAGGARGCLVEGLSVTDFAVAGDASDFHGGLGIDFYDGASDNTVSGCFVGVDPTGLVAEPNDVYQVYFEGGTGDTFGGVHPADRNVVETGRASTSPPTDTPGLSLAGVDFRNEATPSVYGNYLGTDATGKALPSGVAVVDAMALTLSDTTQGALVGNTVPGDQNVIEGVWIGTRVGTPAAGNNQLVGNLIGVDATDTRAFPRGSGYYGVTVFDSTGDLLEGNVIARPDGYAVYAGATKPTTNLALRVDQNQIGTDATGTASFGDAVGLYLDASGVSATGNVIRYDWSADVNDADPTVTGNSVIQNTFGGVGNAVISGSPAPVPVITSAVVTSGGLEVRGQLRVSSPSGVPVHVYWKNPADGSLTDVGSTTLNPTADNQTRFDLTGLKLPGGATTGTLLAVAGPTAAADGGGDTSDFSAPFTIGKAVVAPDDFTGDGLTDQAVYRPSTAQWFLRGSANGLQLVTAFGQAGFGDIPVAGDYLGVGHAQIAVFRPSTSQWFVLGPDGTQVLGKFGAPNLSDIPVPGDYDGTGKTEMAVFRPSTSQWFVDGPSGSHVVAKFGAPNLSDLPVPGDYDGVGYTEPAVYRPATAEWFVDGPNGSHLLGKFGGPGDIPVPGDYDGVGHTEMAVFRPSTSQWFVDGPNGSHLLTVAKYGAPGLGDYPVEAPVGALVKLAGAIHTMSVAAAGGSGGGAITASSFGASAATTAAPPLPPTASSAARPVSRPSAAVLMAPATPALPGSLLASDATRLRRRVAP